MDGSQTLKINGLHELFRWKWTALNNNPFRGEITPRVRLNRSFERDGSLKGPPTLMNVQFDIFKRVFSILFPKITGISRDKQREKI